MSKQHLRSNALRALVTFLAVAFAIGVTAVGAEAKGGKTAPPPMRVIGVTPTPGATDVLGQGVEIEVGFSVMPKTVPNVAITDAQGRTVPTDSPSMGTGDTIDGWVHFRPETCDATGCTYGNLAPGTYTVTIGGRSGVTSTDGVKLSGSDVPGVTVKKGALTFTFTVAA